VASTAEAPDADRSASRASLDRGRDAMLARHELARRRLSEPGPRRPVQPAAECPAVVDRLPEVDATQLDAAVARAAILTHGSLVVRRLVGIDDVVRLRHVIDCVFASVDEASAGRPHDEWYAPFPRRDAALAGTRAWLRSKGGVLTGDSPRATAEVSRVLTACGLARLAEEYLGQPPILSLDKWTLRRGSRANGIEWHQDGAFLGEEVLALNCWLALSECGVSAPSLDVVPRRLSEIVATGTDGAEYGWSVGDAAAARAAGPDGWHRPRFSPGDALLFDDKLLHRTGASPSMTDVRYAVETWFFGPSGDTHYIDVPLVL
jgi:Phytanoyl-CoA dioxygenase (PhyH)